MYLKGKSEAFAGLRDKLAEEMVGAGLAREEEVKGVLEGKAVSGG